MNDDGTAKSYLIEVRGLKPYLRRSYCTTGWVVSYRGTWVETYLMNSLYLTMIGSYLIEVRGLKHQLKGHFD